MIDLSDSNVVQTEKMCMEAVKRDGYALQHVTNQTEAICIEAVKKHGYALQFVRRQTESICMEAVRENGYALGFVKRQTKAICMEAIKQTGHALEYVHNQTEAICMESVKRSEHALLYVHDQTDAICLEALKSSSDWYDSSGNVYNSFEDVYDRIKYPSPQLITELLKLYPSHTDTMMTTYATDIMKIYANCRDIICAYLVRHMADLLYRPNNVNALVSHARWYVTTNTAKTVFLMM